MPDGSTENEVRSGRDRLRSAGAGLRDGPLSHVWGGLRKMLSERSTKVYFGFLVLILFMALFGPMLAPYEHDERVRGDEGELLRSESPTMDNYLGTTDGGYDVFSLLLYGARPTVTSGVLGGLMIISIGLTVGLVSGYVGGRVDDVLMRFTDIAYGVPLIPFALVLVGVLGVGYWTSILIIGLVLWRSSARVIRAQTLQITERPFVLAAKATGASTPRIIVRHILPNVAPMAVLFFALGTGYTIIVKAGLAFLGVTNPFVPDWGVILRNAHNADPMGNAWWWSIPPGLLIALTVLSLFMLGRGYENITDDSNDRAADEAMIQ